MNVEPETAEEAEKCLRAALNWADSESAAFKKRFNHIMDSYPWVAVE